MTVTTTASPAPALPDYRVIIALDIENSTALTNPAKARLRQVMYGLLELALLAANIEESERDPLVDRGDGVLALIHSTAPGAKVRLLGVVVPTLNQLLVDHNVQHPELAMRLRAVVHAGDVHHDQRGCFGESLDIAFRLLDSPKLKRALKDRRDALMILVVSEEIRRTVVEHEYPGVESSDFTQSCQVRTSRSHHRGWLRFP